MSAGISYRDELRRKLIHLSSLWMPLVMIFLPQHRWLLAVIFGGLCIGSLLVEHAYANGNRAVVKVYRFFFRDMLRKEPVPGQWVISGGPYVLAAACLSLLLFPSKIAACGMAVMLLGDTAAALIGRKWGKHKLVNGKSLQGFVGFFAFGSLGCFAFLALGGFALPAYYYAVAGVLLADLAELFEKQIRLDDNFSIPLAVGGVLSLSLV